MRERSEQRPRAVRKRGRGADARLHRPRDRALSRYVKSTVRDTYLLHFVVALVLLWAGFAAALYIAEQHAEQPAIDSYGAALYWGVAAFSTAGIADSPSTGLAQLIGAVWIVVGSVIFFGIIVATVTGYFMRPVKHPLRRLVNLIEYNLENIQELSIEELDLLKETTDALIQHVEKMKAEHARRTGASRGPE